MKNIKKKKTKIKKDKLTFPKELFREDYFKCPIWFAKEDKFVNELNKASDSYIEAAKKNLKKDIDERNKKYGDKGDMGHVFHSTTLIGDPNFNQLINYVGATSHNLLNEMGFDLTNFQIFTTEMWVQEFAQKGGGHHTLHTHWNGHMSGFYKPGRMIFFPSYMPHQYALDIGYKPFRFIHWNCQAIPKGVLNVVQK